MEMLARSTSPELPLLSISACRAFFDRDAEDETADSGCEWEDERTDSLESVRVRGSVDAIIVAIMHEPRGRVVVL